MHFFLLCFQYLLCLAASFPIYGLLAGPHYTRPIEFQGMAVPGILRSGNHALIAEWRLKQSLQRTLARRPDLLEKRELTPQESRLLHEIKQEERESHYNQD